MSDLEAQYGVPKNLPTTLPVLPLRKGTLLPGAVSPFTVGRARSLKALEAVGTEGWLIIATQRSSVEDPAPSDMLPVATLARVVQHIGQQNNYRAVLIQGTARVSLRDFGSIEPYLETSFEVIQQPWPESPEAEGMRRSLLTAISEVADLIETNQPVTSIADQVDDPPLLVDLIASILNGDLDWQKDILLTKDPLARAEKVLKQVAYTREVVSVQKAIKDRVMSDVKGMEREVMLRKQLKAIREELGESGGEGELGRINEKLEEANLPDEVREVVERELQRLDRISEGSPERAVTLDWLEWVADLPWQVYSNKTVSLFDVEQELDATHYGLEDVKRQVVEHLAVRKLAGVGRADVLLLVGPPGVGKTSIAQAIADATKRKLVRVALGGVRDTAELRGHRRTYVGARPGRLIEGLRRAGTGDPVVVLDEVDKLGRGWQGDPAAALLEILDPEQNHAFVDHYMEVAFDLSKVLFISTANDLSSVPPALKDRMEVIEIEGYTESEKILIAQKHLLTKLALNTGIGVEEIEIEEGAMAKIIAGYTREAGVRQLQRALGRIFRAAAVKKAKDELEEPLRVTAEDVVEYLGREKYFEDEHEAPQRAGIATGLAWTPVGGDVLYVEGSLVPGSGKLVTTGQLGEVMKESAQAALTYVLSHAEALGVKPDALLKKDVHLHVPAGATPKDGPSAGVTMFTALASLLSNRPVQGHLAMTGEVTLRGRVLPVGGIKSKALAAHSRGIRRLILPRRNEADVAELPQKVKDALDIVLVDHMHEVLEAALAPSVKQKRAPAIA